VAPGAGFEPARGRINSAVPSQLGYPGKTLVGNLGVEPSASAFQAQRISVFLVPETLRTSNLGGPSGLEPESQVSETCALSNWTMDRWSGRRYSNPNPRLRKPALCPVELRPFGFGVAGGNRILVDGSTDRRLTTRPRPQLVPGARVARACPAFQTGASTPTAFLANLVEEEGIEPPSAGCRPAVLPLNDSPKTGCGLAS
jgi:hypothetical protein